MVAYEMISSKDFVPAFTQGQQVWAEHPSSVCGKGIATIVRLAKFDAGDGGTYGLVWNEGKANVVYLPRLGFRGDTVLIRELTESERDQAK